MDADQWRSVEEAYATLAELSGDTRSRALEALRARQPDVAAEVESLLAARADAGSFLSAGWHAEPAHAAPLVGRTIGAYRVLAALGEGGMGAVYLAEQQAPLQRPVALKVITRGLDSREAVSRFESNARPSRSWTTRTSPRCSTPA